VAAIEPIGVCNVLKRKLVGLLLILRVGSKRGISKRKDVNPKGYGNRATISSGGVADSVVARASGSKSAAMAAAKARKRASSNVRARGARSPAGRTVGLVAGK
jgi:hypothetical protein